MPKLNYGCGKDYREDWVNLDINPEVRADVHVAPSDPVPFPDNYFDEVLLDNVLEHIPRTELFSFLDEIYRICSDKAVVRVYVPHYTSVFAWANISHHSVFAVGAFDCCRPVGGMHSGERYGKAAFMVKRQRLLLIGHNPVRCKWLGRIPVNGLFNINWIWQKLMERFQIFGFDEIYFELQVVKS